MAAATALSLSSSSSSPYFLQLRRFPRPEKGSRLPRAALIEAKPVPALRGGASGGGSVNGEYAVQVVDAAAELSIRSRMDRAGDIQAEARAMTRAVNTSVYSPELVAARYGSRPIKVLQRTVEILTAVGSFAFKLFLDKRRGLLDQRKRMRAAELRRIFTRLGPTFVKIGQGLSTRPDICPPEFLEELSELQAFPKDAAYLNIAITNYVELEIVCGLGHATGEWAKYGNSQTPLGTEEIHVGDDEPSQFTDLGEDGSMPTEWSDMHIMDDSTATTKKPLPSSGIGSGSKRKSKTSAIDKDIHECIFLMADSVTEVANAIKNSTTSPKQIRNMYTELMFELTNIPCFSDKEVYTIYDNLSKNPTLIPSFLSKPKDSKARWMRKKLRN
ncbi:hypothetical protein M5K25_009230 [Dendrobium thyrsiflorum]|uniref:Uncharacterized protein n=1 Tax=Dendrobium thyrsiflorum TaxID=117978 RepID=A0ABD0V4J1_DENTH